MGDGSWDLVFWGICCAIFLLAIGVIARAMVSARAEVDTSKNYDLRVYKDQLAEVDKDVQRGVLSEAEAERVRTEVARRILATDTISAEGPQSRNSNIFAVASAGAIAAAIGVGSFVIYAQIGAPGYPDLGLAQRIEMAEIARQTRPAQDVAETAAPAAEPENTDPEFLEIAQQLRATVAERPDDVQGHQFLVNVERTLGNFRAAYRAQARLIELSGGEEAPVTLWVTYLDLLVLAAGEYVSPEAEEVVRKVLERDPSNAIARYYLGLMHVQTGRPDIAFRLWDALLREGPDDAPWIEIIRARMMELAMRAGQPNYQMPRAGARGPSQEDLEAAENMSPAERMEMISGMVSGLSDRLANEGGPPEDWAQLISALGVLTQMSQADAIYREALVIFADDPAALDMINGAADRAGLR